jgi:integrase
MGKRANGEGTIVRRQDGRWVAAIVVGGRRKFFYGRTRDAVHRKLTSAVKARQDGLPLPTGRETLRTYISIWLAGTEGSVRSSTLEKYRGDLERHVLPCLGTVPLQRLGPQDIQRRYSELIASGLSPTSVRHVHAALHRALGQALRWGLVTRNVADLVTLPQLQRTSWQVLSADEVRRLLAAAATDRLEAVYVLACTAGMRRGEVLALRWRDVDLERGTLAVTGSLQRSSAGLTITEPKTARSRRLVVLSSLAVEALRRRQRRQVDERSLSGSLWLDRGLVFTSAVGGPIEPGNLLRRSFWPLLDRAELPHVRFHDLRHTAATLMLSRGVHPKVASELLGHATVGITLDLYSHVSESMQREAARAMDDLLTPD